MFHRNSEKLWCFLYQAYYYVGQLGSGSVIASDIAGEKNQWKIKGALNKNIIGTDAVFNPETIPSAPALYFPYLTY